MDFVSSNENLVAYFLWPVCVVICGILNMWINKGISWSELLFDYAVGIVIGVCFVEGTRETSTAITAFLLVMAQGMSGILHLSSVRGFSGFIFFFLS